MNSGINRELENHIPYLRKLVWSICRDSQLLDDISQERCVQIIEAEKNWDGNKEKSKKWLAAIAGHATLRRVKKENLEKQMKIEFDENRHVVKKEMPVISES